MNRRFFRKLALFLLPLGALIAAGLGLAVYSGEAMPLSVVIALQTENRSMIYRPTHFNNLFGYKLLMTIHPQPEVLLMGSSRALSFRSVMFSKIPVVFYNAAAPAWGLQEYQMFLQAMEGQAHPHILLLELDLPVFNPDFSETSSTDEFNSLPLDFNYVLQNSQALMHDLVRGQINLTPLLDRRNQTALGVAAIRNGRGFRWDGSIRFNQGVFVPVSIQHNVDQDLERLRAGSGVYLHGTTVSNERLRQVANILNDCRQQGVFVIGFSAPYLPLLYQEMMADGEHTYIPEAASHLSFLFDQAGFRYFDFSDPASLGLTAGDFYDGWHGGEYAALQMYIEMLRQLPDVLGPYSDLDTLQTTANGATNHNVVFPPVG